jgi:hypothetical protein
MKYLLLILLFSISAQLKAQVPQKMSYQAVIRDVNNNLLSSRNIRMRVSIMKSELESSAVYIETHIGKTNLNGLASLQIGTGDIMIGDFKKIDWSKGPYFVKTETDPDGGFDFRITGTSELLSVPYALYALNNTASFDTTSLHTRIVNLQSQAAENKKNIELNIDSIKANAAQSEINIIGIRENAAQSEINIIGIRENAAQSEINIIGIRENAAQSEINIIGIRENAAQIAKNLDSINANSVKIKNNIDTINTKIDVLDLIAILSSYQKVGKIINAFTVDAIDSIDIKSNGNLHSSKNIALSGNIESLGVNSSIGTIEKPFKDLYISSNSLYIASDAVGQNIPPTVLSNLNGNLQISSGGFKLLGVNAAFIAPKFEGRLIGNANTATILETARTINGIPFDGSSNINISTANANLTGVVTSIDNVTSIASGTITNSMLANAAVANLSGVNTGDQILPSLNSLGGVASNIAITGGTKTKISFDSKGLVTFGTNATTADIAASTNKNYMTDAQVTVLSNTSGVNSGDQPIPTLESLRRSENETDPYFDESGILSKLTLSSNTAEKQTEEIDLTKTIHKLTGKDLSNYLLRDGFEGQVIYILPFGDDTNLSNIKITILNGTYWKSSILTTSDEIRALIWTPFSASTPANTMATAIFTEKKWFFTGGTSAIQR